MSEKVETIKPYGRNDTGKGKEVESMFDNIAPAYDFMNTAMTFGLCRSWRDKALKAVSADGYKPEVILDLATGTGDVALRLHELFPDALITGLDLSEGMLEIARKKLKGIEGSDKLTFIAGDSLELPFADNSFDLITVAYGVRNFSDLAKGYSEMFRVLKPGGRLCVIELSRPANPVLLGGYRLYSETIIPLAGRLVSRDARAYSYLPESIAACPQRDTMTALITSAGFADAKWKTLTFGSVCYYTAAKALSNDTDQ